MCSRGTMGGLILASKGEGCPSEMTPEMTTQSLGNTTLRSCLCQWLGMTQQKKAPRVR